MKTRTVISAKLDELSLIHWDEEAQEAVDLETTEETAAALKCSSELADALLALVDSIKELGGSDLRDIWEQVTRKN